MPWIEYFEGGNYVPIIVLSARGVKEVKPNNKTCSSNSSRSIVVMYWKVQCTDNMIYGSVLIF